MTGTWPQGFRLEAARLADELGVSMTPVRDCLNQLTGEGLVDFTAGDGFRVPRITEYDYRNMLDVNELLLVEAAGSHWLKPAAIEERSQDDHATRIASAFRMLVEGSGNRYAARVIDRISQRLYRLRVLEPDILPLADRQLNRLEECLLGSARQRRTALSNYHRSCRENATRLIERPDI